MKGLYTFGDSLNYIQQKITERSRQFVLKIRNARKIGDGIFFFNTI